MELDGFKEFLSAQSEMLRKLYPEHDDKCSKLARTVKLMEEVGELCNEILHNMNTQRPDKLKSNNFGKLSEEFADVFITLCLVGENFNINIEKAIKDKIEKIRNRKY